MTRAGQVGPQFTVGDRFRILEKADAKIRYVVIEVDAEGGVFCHDEKELERGNGRSLMVHRLTRRSIDAIYGRGDMKLAI